MRVRGTTRMDDSRIATLEQLGMVAKMLSSSQFFALIVPEVSVNSHGGGRGSERDGCGNFSRKDDEGEKQSSDNVPPEF
ncbi:MAG: hypothetical protein ACUVTL_01180 [Thermoproteota archaeon]